MKVTVNGDEKEVKDGTTVFALIDKLGISCARVAVERNLEIVAPEAYDRTELQEGDRLEIVSFVGGG